MSSVQRGQRPPVPSTPVVGRSGMLWHPPWWALVKFQQFAPRRRKEQIAEPTLSQVGPTIAYIEELTNGVGICRTAFIVLEIGCICRGARQLAVHMMWSGVASTLVRFADVAAVCFGVHLTVLGAAWNDKEIKSDSEPRKSEATFSKAAHSSGH
ncbi:hypothetical protein MTO96_051772 [Rhipicephalus appendiculatus]